MSAALHETLAILEVKSGKCGRCGETTWLTDRFAADGVKWVNLCADCGQKAQAYVASQQSTRGSQDLDRQKAGGEEAATETQRRTLDGRPVTKARDGASPNPLGGSQQRERESVAPAQLPASLTVPEVEPVAAKFDATTKALETTAKTGLYVPIEVEGPRGPYGRCTPHARLLTYKEQQAGFCWWCHPEKSPEDHSVRKLSRDQLEKLIVVRA